jgi:hypothetical protein
MGANQSWQVTNIPICLIPVISDLQDTHSYLFACHFAVANVPYFEIANLIRTCKKHTSCVCSDSFRREMHMIVTKHTLFLASHKAIKALSGQKHLPFTNI